MSSDHSTKIETAVAECLENCDPHKMPYSSVEKFITRLKSDPAWTAAEVFEVQTQVIRTILARVNDAR